MKIKDYFDKKYAVFLANKIKSVYNEFDVNRFIHEISDKIANQEYSEKMKIFAEALYNVLPNYIKALDVFEKMLGQELSSISNMYNDGMWLAPISKYIEIHCVEHEEYFDNTIHFIVKEHIRLQNLTCSLFFICCPF